MSNYHEKDKYWFYCSLYSTRLLELAELKVLNVSPILINYRYIFAFFRLSGVGVFLPVTQRTSDRCETYLGLVGIFTNRWPGNWELNPHKKKSGVGFKLQELHRGVNCSWILEKSPWWLVMTWWIPSLCTSGSPINVNWYLRCVIIIMWLYERLIATLLH